ncbi:hypothetical protein CRENBAI_002188 [Crenichthys baileyi]|uniref:Uncharacterized protein n=1 Tax=Crenichthys baileyi TaxID=28760 RepID=A0AAV9RVI5_9TELE
MGRVGGGGWMAQSSQQRPCLYNTKWSSFPGLKEGQRDRITVATAVTCSLAGPTEQAAPPHSYGVAIEPEAHRASVRGAPCPDRQTGNGSSPLPSCLPRKAEAVACHGAPPVH